MIPLPSRARRPGAAQDTEAPPIIVRLPGRSSEPEREEVRRYRLAGEVVTLDGGLPELEAFAAGCPEATGPRSGGAPPGRRGDMVYAGPGWIGDRYRRVVTTAAGAGWRVEIEGVGALAVGADSSVTWLDGPEGPAAARLLSEATLGPGLVLALALRGVYCLHASAAIAPDGGVVAFLGPSGAGKSTLARLLDGAPEGWRRAADDVLPVRFAGTSGDPLALPWFPQLKLPSDRQPGPASPERAPLAALYVLSTGDPSAVRRRPLSRAEATLALVKHTVASRLFDRELLADHMGFCARVGRRLPVFELAYPRRGTVVPGLLEAVEPTEEAA